MLNYLLKFFIQETQNMKTKLCSFLLLLCLAIFFSACQKELSINDLNTPGTTTGTAKFTFSGTPGNCTNTSVSGTYQAGTGLGIANTINVEVNVTDTGSYNITSTSANGIKFSTAGIFISKGIQSIIFIGSGTPAAAGSFNLTLSAGGCTFVIICSGTPPVSNNDCKACTYVPLCVGTKYSFNDTAAGTATVRNSDLLSSVDTIIDAKIYQKIIASNGVAYYNCTNGETTAVGYQLISNNGNTLQKIKLTMLKANAVAGATWADTMVNSSGQTVIQNFKIVKKGISKTLGPYNFTNIIEVELETGIDLQGTGYIPFTTSVYSYAKAVGLVEITTRNYGVAGNVYHSVIKSYFIP